MVNDTQLLLLFGSGKEVPLARTAMPDLQGGEDAPTLDVKVADATRSFFN
jgi:hypothetical protein